MGGPYQYLHDVLAALAQCAHRGGTTHTDKGQADVSDLAGGGVRSAEENDAAADVTAAIAAAEAAETAAAAAAAAEAAAVAARGRSHWRHPGAPPTIPYEASPHPANYLAASMDILMAFVVMHLLQVGFRPDIGSASISTEPSIVKLSPSKSMRRAHIPTRSEHRKGPIGTVRKDDDLDYEDEQLSSTVSRRHPPKHHAHHVRAVTETDNAATLSRTSSKENPENLDEPSHGSSTADDVLARSDTSKPKMRQRRPSSGNSRGGKVKSLRQPKGIQTFTRHHQLEQQRLRRLKALRLQQTQNQRINSAIPPPMKLSPRKHIGGQQLIRGRWSTIAKMQNLIDPEKGPKSDRSSVELAKKSSEKKKLPLTESEIVLMDLKSFLSSSTFVRCAKMVSVCGWSALEQGSYSMSLRLPPLHRYRFSLIGLPAAWHDVLVVNVALLPDKKSELERLTATKITQSEGPVTHISVYTVALALTDFIDRTPDGPRLKIGHLPRLLSLLRNSLSHPAACAARTASGILNSSFLGLPASAALRILYYLSVRTIAQVAKTCRALRSLTLQPRLWKYLIERDFGPPVDIQGDTAVDWKKEYILLHRQKKAEIKERNATLQGLNNVPSSEIVRNCSSATHRSCGVNVESAEILKDSRKLVRSPSSVKFAIHRPGSEHRVTPIKPAFRAVARAKSTSGPRKDSETHATKSPHDVLTSLCSYANTNLLENCNVNTFNFDEVLESDVSAWNSGENLKNQQRDKSERRLRYVHRGSKLDPSRSQTLRRTASKHGDSLTHLRKITASAADIERVVQPAETTKPPVTSLSPVTRNTGTLKTNAPTSLASAHETTENTISEINSDVLNSNLSRETSKVSVVIASDETSGDSQNPSPMSAIQHAAYPKSSRLRNEYDPHKSYTRPSAACRQPRLTVGRKTRSYKFCQMYTSPRNK